MSDLKSSFAGSTIFLRLIPVLCSPKCIVSKLQVRSSFFLMIGVVSFHVSRRVQRNIVSFEGILFCYYYFSSYFCSSSSFYFLVHRVLLILFFTFVLYFLFFELLDLVLLVVLLLLFLLLFSYNFIFMATLLLPLRFSTITL